MLTKKKKSELIEQQETVEHMLREFMDGQFMIELDKLSFMLKKSSNGADSLLFNQSIKLSGLMLSVQQLDVEASDTLSNMLRMIEQAEVSF
ncbi:hypothetical protein [Fructobacillus cardui]|uniref:hypothetical protein n=1 Tax=Fructobacillus cardui TaxID=2893170 RepID=UPI002D9669CC|nr:unnamed protein product [Fructobacillus cardui]